MIRILPALFLFTGCVVSVNSVLADQQATTIDSGIHNIAAEFVKSGPQPGVIMAIAEAGQPLRIAAAGTRKYGDSPAMTIEDKMHLGSCTKAMTATLVARLAEKNQIKFNSTIAQVLPDLTPYIHRQYHNVTIEQLLTHQSGMPENPPDWWINEGDPVSRIRWTIATTALAKKPAFQPGSQTLYSNLGYMIAGLMVEKTGGATWEQMISRYVFEPMGLSSAGFGPPSINGNTDQPWGHEIKLFGRIIARQLDNAPALGPAGRVHMNFHDWATFLLAHATDGQSMDDPSFLSTASWQKLHKPLRGEFAPGWFIHSRKWADGTTYSHSGSNTMWFSTVWIAPNQNKAYLIGTNAAGRRTANDVDAAIANLIRLDRKK